MLLLFLLAQAAPFTPPPVPDPELAEMRGGFRLPNGVDVAITVDTRTAVDGAVVLQTIFRADQGRPTLAVYTPKPGETATLPRPAGSGAGTPNAPVITYDSRSGIQVAQTATMPSSVIFSGRGSNGGTAGAGLEAAPAGSVVEAVRGGVRTVEVARDDLTITHFAGNAFGSAIANMASDRTIDTQTSIAIDLRNAGPDVVGSSLLRVEGVALEAARMRF